MTIEMRADKTNIHANEQMKIVRFAFEFINAARTGTEPFKEAARVVRAD